MTPSEIGTEIVKATPPVVITTAITIFSLELETWIKICTLIYVVLQIAFILVKMRRLDVKEPNDE